MTAWRAKDMTAAECASFQRVFETAFNMTILNRNMALFLHSEEREPGGTVAIRAIDSFLLEMASPGGWRPMASLKGPGWRILAGHHAAGGDREVNDALAEGPFA